MKRGRRVEPLLAVVLSAAAAVYVAWLERAAEEGGPDAPPKSESAEVEPAGTGRVLRVGWTAWADAEWVTHLVARILEERLDQPVELVMADIGLQYQGLVSGDLDAMLMAWLPVTHRDYYERVSGRVVDLGPLYTQARLGWLVPDAVPRDRLASIEDLRDREVRRRLEGRIQGIDPGSGLMRVSRKALRRYRLEGWKLVPASAAAMTAALDRAIRRGEWIVVTGWSPHWIFARYPLRYLEDPLGVLGGPEGVHALVSEHFERDFPPRVMGFFSRLQLPLEAVEHALLVVHEQSLDAAVEDFLSREAERVDYWVTGEP